jgi:predicted N-acetyltransferase YhbS
MLDDYATVIERHTAFVAEKNGEVVGVLVLAGTDAGMLLDNVAVHPAHQAKGLGRRLIELAESEARAGD